ncbi:MAG: TetR/AcrR family transcriptional regulator [Nannocystaceae bacterium]|nr:TetR/AcrR family transcriptional regulator [Myxococcales bacterium]
MPTRGKGASGVARRLQVDERRQQLLELGIELFGAQGYQELSIDAIARAAGVSKGLLYHYFSSKRDYYVAAVRFAAELLLSAIEDAAGDEPSPEGLSAAIDAYLDFVDRHQAAYQALMRGGLGADGEVIGVVEDTRRQICALILERLGLEEPPPQVRVSVRGWVGFAEAASLDWLDHRDIPKPELRDLLAATMVAVVELIGEGLVDS